MKQMNRFIECADESSSSRSAKRPITNAGKARVRRAEPPSQKVQAAAKAQQMGYQVKARMRKAIKKTIPNEKPLEE